MPGREFPLPYFRFSRSEMPVSMRDLFAQVQVHHLPRCLIWTGSAWHKSFGAKCRGLGNNAQRRPH